MPKPRATQLETATARRRLPQAKVPIWVRISVGIHLGYRRNAGPGTWSVRRTGDGAQWIKRIGVADDLEPADGKEVLTFWQAQEAARKLARRQPGDEAAIEGRPVTVDEALEAYERELLATSGDPYNARRARLHLPPTMASKPVALLSARELVAWRDGLLAKGLSRASVNRTRNCLRAALTLAAKRDRSIGNRGAWQDDLEALPNAVEARNVILPDAQVSKLVAAAFERDDSLGLLIQVLAETGARSSQVARLTISDLDAKGARLLMPRSAKGHAHKRAAKRLERVPVPISAALAARLAQAAKERPADAPLLVRTDGSAWGHRRVDRYREEFRAVVETIGLDPDVVTAYALRHSAISRSILRGVPLSLIADLADTSESIIRRHYAKLISNHADEAARRGLIQIEAPAASNVVALKG